ncbi:RDD family protein [Luteolibacter ambystomatis]|uniref:RDD family protein n=1 Tax=Luteolibacter ambystomatis TaxID=2824561 RepID=A0A975PGD4_9BACT|nr:RDD family protein [Luteolibacter ambystomatis]QUE52480.1 RDD family protein [Luteolibacter ambystomatis]
MSPSEPVDPYRPPAAPGLPELLGDAPDEFVPLSLGIRFANLILDTIVHRILFQGLRLIPGLGLHWETGGSTWGILAASYAVTIAYYTVMEGAFGRSAGKFFTGTKVVTLNGEAPSYGQAFARSLCRFIPFDAFSFFRVSKCGWHDTIPKTRVVRAGTLPGIRS